MLNPLSDGDLAQWLYTAISAVILCLMLLLALLRVIRIGRSEGPLLYSPVLDHDVAEKGISDTQMTALFASELFASVAMAGVHIAQLAHTVTRSNIDSSKLIEDSCWVAGWLICVYIVTLERRHQLLSCRSLRLWWLACWIISSISLRQDIRSLTHSFEVRSTR